MKTQIANRTILIVIAIFFTLNNNGSNVQSTPHLNNNIIVADNNEIISSYAALIDGTQQSKHSLCLGCSFVNQQDVPAIPEPNGDHEFHIFKINHNEKRMPLWKSIANKIIGAIYYVVVLIAYLPYRMLS